MYMCVCVNVSLWLIVAYCTIQISFSIAHTLQSFKTKYPKAIIKLQVPILNTTQFADLSLTIERGEVGNN